MKTYNALNDLYCAALTCGVCACDPGDDCPDHGPYDDDDCPKC